MTEGSAEDGPRNIFASMRLVFSSSYLRAIAAVICISSLVTTLTGWQFLAIMQQFLVKKDAIAAFYGDFNFYAGILSLLFQLLLTTGSCAGSALVRHCSCFRLRCSWVRPGCWFLAHWARSSR